MRTFHIHQGLDDGTFEPLLLVMVDGNPTDLIIKVEALFDGNALRGADHIHSHLTQKINASTVHLSTEEAESIIILIKEHNWI